MRAIMVMYDSLNRHYLPNYGCDLAKMPNFVRLGEKTVTFDRSYSASLPCMPARRELHTGRLNFLHRGWSPLEPFDDSMPELLKQNGIYTHIISDHQHYWEDGGATYHTRYQSWECVRGQEGDPWKGSLAPVNEEDYTGFGPKASAPQPEKLAFNPVNWRRQDQVNRRYIKTAEDFPQAKTLGLGLEFIEENKDYDQWFLQIETFDPHEPFFAPDEFQALYREAGEAPFKYDWPPYGPTMEDDDFVQKVRKKYFALLSMCDHYLGQVLDLMDRYDMWKDTMLIVNTDHGFMLGEHRWWSKGCMPAYEELVHTPLFIWNPKIGAKNVRRASLVQTIDLAPTILDYFGVNLPKDMQGEVLTPVIEADTPVRSCGLFGFFGAHVNIIDGDYVYMRAPVHQDNEPLYEYTLMPNQMRCRMSPEKLKDIELAGPFEFTKGCRVLKLPGNDGFSPAPTFRYGNLLFNVREDPGQRCPIDDPQKEAEMINAMVRLMKENDAPKEQFERLGLLENGEMTSDYVLEQRAAQKTVRFPEFLGAIAPQWEEGAVWAYKALLNMKTVRIKGDEAEGDKLCGTDNAVMHKLLKDYLERRKETTSVSGETCADGQCLCAGDIFDFAKEIIPEEDYESVLYTMKFIARLD